MKFNPKPAKQCSLLPVISRLTAVAGIVINYRLGTDNPRQLLDRLQYLLTLTITFDFLIPKEYHL